MNAIHISDFPRHTGETATVRGWIANRRSSGKVSFLIVRDGSGVCQAIAERETMGDFYEEIRRLPLESSVAVTGTVVEEGRSPGGYELHVTGMTILQSLQPCCFNQPSRVISGRVLEG